MDDENYNLEEDVVPLKHLVPFHWINRKCVVGNTNCSQRTGDTHTEGGVGFSVMLCGSTEFSLPV